MADIREVKANASLHDYDNVTVQLFRDRDMKFKVRVRVADQHLGPQGMALAREAVFDPSHCTGPENLRRTCGHLAAGLAEQLGEKGSRLDPSSCHRTAMELCNQVFTEFAQRQRERRKPQ